MFARRWAKRRATFLFFFQAEDGIRDVAVNGVQTCALPAWSVSTSWAGSSGDEIGEKRGLNDFGKQVIREMNRLGMMVDVSHVSDPTFWDIVNTSTKPVIATHSGCRALANVPRNLTDEMIVAIAKTGGVVNVIFYPEHLEPGWSEKKKKVDDEIASLVQQASDSEQGDRKSVV